MGVVDQFGVVRLTETWTHLRAKIRRKRRPSDTNRSRVVGFARDIHNRNVGTRADNHALSQTNPQRQPIWMTQAYGSPKMPCTIEFDRKPESRRCPIGLGVFASGDHAKFLAPITRRMHAPIPKDAGSRAAFTRSPRRRVENWVAEVGSCKKLPNMIMTQNINTASRCSRSSAYIVEARVFQDGAQGHRERPWDFF